MKTIAMRWALESVYTLLLCLVVSWYGDWAGREANYGAATGFLRVFDLLGNELVGSLIGLNIGRVIVSNHVPRERIGWFFIMLSLLVAVAMDLNMTHVYIGIAIAGTSYLMIALCWPRPAQGEENGDESEPAGKP